MANDTHCRHYSYAGALREGGPTCAKGLDLSKPPTAWMRCIYGVRPDPGPICPLKEPYTAEEIVTAKAEYDAAVDRVFRIMPMIPEGRNLRGKFACPECKVGEVHWSRSLNGHAWAACSTVACFAVMS